MSSWAHEPAFPFRSRRAGPQVSASRLSAQEREARLRAAVLYAAGGDAGLGAFDRLDLDDALAANASMRVFPDDRPGLLEGVPFAAGAMDAATAALQAEGALLVGMARDAEAVVSGGLAPLALLDAAGLDGVGRARAALHGVVGYKPSASQLSRAGGTDPAWRGVGVLAEDVGHVELAFRAMTGQALEAIPLSRLRLGVCGRLDSDLDQSVDHAWRRVLAGLLRAGVTLAPIDLPGLDRMADLHARRDESAERARAALHGLHGWICPAAPWIDVYDQCAVALPAQWPDMAAPVGIQVAAQAGEDARVLGIARALTHLHTVV